MAWLKTSNSPDYFEAGTELHPRRVVHPDVEEDRDQLLILPMVDGGDVVPVR